MLAGMDQNFPNAVAVLLPDQRGYRGGLNELGPSPDDGYNFHLLGVRLLCFRNSDFTSLQPIKGMRLGADGFPVSV